MNSFERVEKTPTILEISAKLFAREDAVRPLRVATYCRVSTDSEEQEPSIALQEQRYRQLIARTPGWESAGIFCERVTGLNSKERTEVRAMMRKCRKGGSGLSRTKSVSRLGLTTGCAAIDLLESKDMFFLTEIWAPTYRQSV